MSTKDEPAQREIDGDVLARGHSGAPGKSLLSCLVGFGADERFVLALAQRHAPARRFDKAGINRAGQQVRHALKSDCRGAGFRGLRPRLQEPLDLCLDLKPPAGNSFERILAGVRARLGRQ